MKNKILLSTALTVLSFQTVFGAEDGPQVYPMMRGELMQVAFDGNGARLNRARPDCFDVHNKVGTQSAARLNEILPVLPWGVDLYGKISAFAHFAKYGCQMDIDDYVPEYVERQNDSDLSREESLTQMRIRLAEAIQKPYSPVYIDLLVKILCLIEARNDDNLKKVFLLNCFRESTIAYAYPDTRWLPGVSCSEGIIERLVVGMNAPDLMEILPQRGKEEIDFVFRKIAFFDDGGYNQVVSNLLDYCKSFQSVMDKPTTKEKVAQLVDTAFEGLLGVLTNNDEGRKRELRLAPVYPANYENVREGTVQSRRGKRVPDPEQPCERIEAAPWRISFEQGLKNFTAYAHKIDVINLEEILEELENQYNAGHRFGAILRRTDDQPEINPHQESAPLRVDEISNTVLRSRILFSAMNDNEFEVGGAFYSIINREVEDLQTLLRDPEMLDLAWTFVAQQGEEITFTNDVFPQTQLILQNITQQHAPHAAARAEAARAEAARAAEARAAEAANPTQAQTVAMTVAERQAFRKARK